MCLEDRLPLHDSLNENGSQIVQSHNFLKHALTGVTPTSELSEETVLQ